MLFEVIRDGEVSDSERKMMLWSIIVLAQVRDKCPSVRIPVPPSPLAISRYLETQGPTIQSFMCEVQEGDEDGVRESFDTQRKRRRRSWADGMAGDTGAPEDAVGQALTTATRRSFGWLMRFAGTEDLVQQATADELLIACEPPVDIDVYARHGLLVGACLDSLGPVVPDGYLFKARVADFYRLCSVKGQVDFQFLSLALRFFSASLLYTQLRKLPSFVAGALYVRVFICAVDEDAWVLGRLVQALSLLAEKMTDWDRDNEWVGCPAGGAPSAIQWLPDNVATAIAVSSTPTALSFVASGFLVFQRLHATWRLKSAVAAPIAVLVGFLAMRIAELADGLLAGFVASAVQLCIRLIFQPFLRTILNYMFAVVLAKFLMRILETADEVVQPKLLLMSLKLGSRARAAK